MTDDEKLIHLQKIVKAQEALRPHLIAISIAIIIYSITMIICLIELMRVGPFDARTIGWGLMSLIAYIASKTNHPPQEKLDLFTKLVQEYKDNNPNF
jgi:hypothetical protein